MCADNPRAEGRAISASETMRRAAIHLIGSRFNKWGARVTRIQFERRDLGRDCDCDRHFNRHLDRHFNREPSRELARNEQPRGRLPLGAESIRFHSAAGHSIGDCDGRRAQLPRPHTQAPTGECHLAPEVAQTSTGGGARANKPMRGRHSVKCCVRRDDLRHLPRLRKQRSPPGNGARLAANKCVGVALVHFPRRADSDCGRRSLACLLFFANSNKTNCCPFVWI